MCAKMMWFVRQATTIELSMVAAERLRELAWLQPEAWAGLPSAAPAPSWPQSGACAAPSGRRGLGWGEGRVVRTVLALSRHRHHLLLLRPQRGVSRSIRNDGSERFSGGSDSEPFESPHQVANRT
jgi:hypothetical protein